ncbi:MAG: pyruvate kinase [Candidatus Omnitrophica bacterium]|nr:pyruvate kinase [Candidatus Omnitrophota bacterium]
MDERLRRTKIVATIGPACQSLETLKELICAGADVLRINSSHTSPEGLRRWIHLIRQAGASLNREIPILIDLQGPRIRTGALKDKQLLSLRKDEIVSIIPTLEPGLGNGSLQITTPCLDFARMVKKGDPVLLDNGLIDLEVTESNSEKVTCRIITGGLLGENKGINLPNAPMTLPSLAQKDHKALEIAAREGVDYVALSFVRNAKDIETVRNYLKDFGKIIPVIAKIEKPRAVEEIDSIIAVSEGVMVARGDLGIEMGVQKVPVIQKKIIERANQRYIGVITATQMLESMMEHPRPTRAEASDVANAVFDGTDAVMLSGETSIGKYPVEAVRMMSEIIIEAENHQEFQEVTSRKILRRKDHPVCAITHAAQNAAMDLEAKAIVAFTQSGRTAIAVSKFERKLPILAFTPSPEVSRRLALFHGVIPLKLNYCKSTDEMLSRGEQELLKTKFLKEGDAVVVVSGAHALENRMERTSFLR